MNTDTIISFILQAILFYLVFNVFVIGIMVYRQNASKAALNWPSVQGKIKSSRVHRRDIYSTGGDGYPWVEYTYDVNGKTYKSMTISAGGLIMDDQKQAENMVARYPKGADVPVYYNPSDPSKACLQREPIGQTQLWGVLILGNLVMPLIVLLTRFFTHQ